MRLQRGGRSAEPLREDSGHRARARRDRGLHRQGRLDQRDADLLAASATRRSPRRTSAGSSGSSPPAAIPATVLSVASFFVSRVDTEADKRLEAVGRTRPAGEARRREREARLPALPRTSSATTAGRYLAGKGARPQRCLWASTSTKNPAYRDVIYVEELIGPDTVNTMPLETVEAFQDHGEVRRGTPDRRASTRRRRSSPTSRRPASTTTTSSRRSRPRACRSSPTRSPSCSTGFEPRRGVAGGGVTERRQPAARGSAGSGAGRSRARSSIFGASGDLTKRKLIPGALRARLPQAAAGAVRDRRRRAHAADARRSSPRR